MDSRIQITSIILLILLSIGNVITFQRNAILNNEDLEHIKHDVKEQYLVDVGDLSKHELELYNFNLHDYDSNLKLDGLEIMAAIYHDKKDDPEELAKVKQLKFYELNDYRQEQFMKEAESIDFVLKLYDADNDGFISFQEYTKSLDSN